MPFPKPWLPLWYPRIEGEIIKAFKCTRECAVCAAHSRLVSDLCADVKSVRFQTPKEAGINSKTMLIYLFMYLCSFIVIIIIIISPLF